MKNFDFVSHTSWKGKIYLSSFPGLNEQKLFDHEEMEQTLKSISRLGCKCIISLVEKNEIEDICKKINLDFAIDMNCYTEGGRIDIFQNKLAPIPVSYTHLTLPTKRIV